MSSKTSTVRMTSGERFARGLKHSASGPVDITRGALGIGLTSAKSSVAWLGSHYRHSARVAQETLATELAAGREVVANLPETLQNVRRSRRRPRPLLLALAGAAVLGVGAVTFSIVRRSTQPDPSLRPPSVEVTPKP
ncbi:MAG: hypothetical protein QOD90_5970 [Mycobacterium sp.]|jgi:hypothetical protein|nr:hypothetical protein [Mycobacterium sp.]